ncbi:MAG: FAD-dependent oxidoreductase [Actinobacteria bacterium]|nr:FAD-dependent oxidoreductase [Actinomycetota bacterium]
MSILSTPLWQDGADRGLRPSLNIDLEADVVVVGGGYTGLWTAYYLKTLSPNLSIVIIESQRIGFGGSGRNGGWCSAFLPMSPAEMSAKHGERAMRFIQHQMFDTVDEIERITTTEKINCGFRKGGTLTSASNSAHVERIQNYVRDWHSAGFDDSVMRWENANQVRERINVDKTFGGMFSPHCAAIHPFDLVTGLANAVERLGVTIYEQSRVVTIEPHEVRTKYAKVRARWVVRAIESFASQMQQTKRTIAPLYSLMVATEPLSPHVWKEIGWTAHETFADGRNMVTYAQRTEDGRIAFGGRGAPYHFGSRISSNYDQHRVIQGHLKQLVRETFPILGEVRFTHEWGGPVGAPRDWHAFANVDPRTGICSGGGYVGDGVALSNLVARTLAHQILGTESPLTNSLLVNHRAKQWEREPLRWFGINGLLKLTDYADRREQRTGKPSTRMLAIRDGMLG